MTTSHPLHATQPSDRTIAREAKPTPAVIPKADEQLEMTCRAQWEASAELREQFFGGFETWVAFARARPDEAKRLVPEPRPHLPASVSAPLPPSSSAPIAKGDENPQLRALLKKIDAHVPWMRDAEANSASSESTQPQTNG